MKFKGIKFIFICLIISAAMFGIFNLKYTNSFAEDEIDYTAISSISQISDPNGKYILSEDITISNTESTIVFTGELNGNGHTISFEQSNNVINSVFKTVGQGAKIYNLRFNNKTNNQQSLLYLANTNALNGMLAHEIDGATILNIEFSNCMVEIFSNNTFDTLNVGFLAGSIKNSSVSGIKFSNSIITTAEESLEENQKKYHTLKSNTNIGFVAGKISSSTISNNLVESSEMNLHFEDSIATDYNFGAIAGLAENTRFINNIVNLYKASQTEVLKTINLVSNVSKNINFGGIVGKVSSGEKSAIFNNFVLLDANSIAVPAALTNINIGSMVGNLFYSPKATNISGFVTSFLGNIFGVQTQSVAYSKLSKLEYANINSSIFKNKDKWHINDEYSWNYNQVWLDTTGIKYPTLQAYQSFEIAFDSVESANSLNLEVPPINKVVEAKISNSIPTDADTETLSNVAYGSTLYIKVKILDENFYKHFFYIAELRLDCSTTNQISTLYSNENNSINVLPNVSCSFEGEEDAKNEYIYKIENINANLVGTYSVVLKTNVFKLNVKVYDVGTEETGSIIPGKFKTNTDTNPVSQRIINLEYGKNYIVNTADVHEDYSDRADFYIFDNSQKDVFEEPVKFNPEEQTANHNSNKFEWTFTENPNVCTIFKPDETGEEDVGKFFFDIENYQESTLEDGTIASNYELIVFYPKRVKEIKIVLKYDNEELIKEQVAKLLINNKSDRISWDAEEGVYYAKVPFDVENTLTYLIKVDELQAGMEFDDWYFEIEKLIDVPDDVFAGEFEVEPQTEDTLNEQLTIYCVFKHNAQKAGGSLMWLWISLATVGAVILVFIIIKIIKRRGGGGGKSYKKYYY